MELFQNAMIRTYEVARLIIEESNNLRGRMADPPLLQFVLLIDLQGSGYKNMVRVSQFMLLHCTNRRNAPQKSEGL
jgi:hypothetical protein